MDGQDPIILYILLRESLSLDSGQCACCAANALEHILMKYFTMQLLAVKYSIEKLSDSENIRTTTKWLGSHSKKHVSLVSDEIWEKVKTDFPKEAFLLKNDEEIPEETTLVFFPRPLSEIPDYLKVR